MIPDGRFPRVRFRPWLFLPPPAQRRGGSSAGSPTPLSAVVGMRNSSVLTGRSCPAQCPGPPKDRQVPRASSHSRGITPCVAAFTPHRWALPHPRRYYRPMRQTTSLSPPTTTGLGRRVFAGCGQPLLGSGPSRRYLCRSFSGCQAPCRGGSSRCTCPLLPSTTSAFPDKGTGRPSRENPLSDFRAGMISQLQAFRDVLASRFACHPGRSHRCGLAAGQPWRFHPSTTCVVTFARFGYASRPNRAIDGWGLSPHKTRSLVGCSPLSPFPCPSSFRCCVADGRRTEAESRKNPQESVLAGFSAPSSLYYTCPESSFSGRIHRSQTRGLRPQILTDSHRLKSEARECRLG